jgi:CBS domain-containing protein
MPPFPALDIGDRAVQFDRTTSVAMEREMKAKDVMTTKVTTISPDNSVRQAAKVMLARRVSGLPVIDDDGGLVGLISEGDLLRRSELGSGTVVTREGPPSSSDQRARTYVKSNAWRVGDVMSRDLVVVDEEAPLSRVAALMEEHAIKRVPVVRGGALVGIVSRANLLRAIVAARPDQTVRGDDAIRRSIVARLNENTGLEGKNVTVTVTGGTVHLWGGVDTEDCRNAARVVAEGVRGVRDVIEHFPQKEPPKRP